MLLRCKPTCCQCTISFRAILAPTRHADSSMPSPFLSMFVEPLPFCKAALAFLPTITQLCTKHHLPQPHIMSHCIPRVSHNMWLPSAPRDHGVICSFSLSRRPACLVSNFTPSPPPPANFFTYSFTSLTPSLRSLLCSWLCCSGSLRPKEPRPGNSLPARV